MNREQAINYLLSSGMSEEQVNTVVEAFTCEDAISRAELLKAIDTWDRFGVDDTNSLFRLDNLSLPHYVPYIHYDNVIKCIKGMPSVTPKPKTGQWIENAPECQNIDPPYICSECGNMHLRKTNYCDQCGAKMVDPQESEV